MPSRSTNIEVDNNTGADLVLADQGLSHGIWTEGLFPPQLIRNGDSGKFQAESAGFMTGDQGYATYSSSAGKFTFNFDNPYVGSNDESAVVPNGYTASRRGGGGDNSEITWKLEKVN
ncbi:hypothetical protein FBEOM_1878 [Fusarium beomiforme]|uniref:Crystal protein ET79 n=1 Tax=Fusarium beomiforme TaxID=44412 RepID=A0A9P5E0N2_9HYPO|nr:hypothetical protein FBEOM_1878 [Fusarium beomiforme]